MQVTIDETTRILHASRIAIKEGVKKVPFDFAREKGLVLDSTGRPVATITPLSASPNGRPVANGPPVAASVPVATPSPTPPPPAPAAPTASALSSTPRVATVSASDIADAEEREAPTGSRGRLTDAHVEHLQRLWLANPRKSPAWIAAEFARRHGREISERLAIKHAPADVAERLSRTG